MTTQRVSNKHKTKCNKGIRVKASSPTNVPAQVPERRDLLEASESLHGTASSNLPRASLSRLASGITRVCSVGRAGSSFRCSKSTITRVAEQPGPTVTLAKVSQGSRWLKVVTSTPATHTSKLASLTFTVTSRFPPPLDM